MSVIETINKQDYYLIAEIGVNYYDIATKLGISNMEAAKLMVMEAKNAGIDAVKFQTYKASTLAAKNSPSYWDTSEEATTSQYELFKKFDSFGKAEYEELAKYSQSIGVDFLSTPFDYESADYLYDYMNEYKISSSDLSNLPFIEHMSKKGKQIILSTGASNLDEIQTAVDLIHRTNDVQLALLHCVLEYPTVYEHANLEKIVSLKKAFPECIIGYSDHTKPDACMDVIKMAYLYGAQIIEKHFTLDKTLPGNDHYHAMNPEDVKKIKEGLEFLKVLKGSGELTCLDSERAARMNARRSIVSNGDIKKGTVITRDMLTFKRPGTGISPSKIDAVIGKVAALDIEDDTILQSSMLED